MIFRDEELLVNDGGEGEDDYDPDEDVRTLKNPALEELSLGMLGTFSFWWGPILKKVSPWKIPLSKNYL